jgi:Ca2+/H+ antiporter
VARTEIYLAFSLHVALPNSGTAFLVGGIKHSAQAFNTAQTHLGSGMLLLSCMCIIFPAVLIADKTEKEEGASGLLLSRIAAVRGSGREARQAPLPAILAHRRRIHPLASLSPC